MQRVEIINSSEFVKADPDGGSNYVPANFEGHQGELIGTIPPGNSSPNRLMVRLDGGPIVNFRPEDVRTVEEEKLPNASM